MRSQPFLKSSWYMAAWSDEIGEALTRRRLIGEPVVMYRTASGDVAALTDRCPHRFAPLSSGERTGDVIRCPYHGLEFDRSGICVRNPFADTIPKSAKVRCWPTLERDGIVWFWAGEPEQADTSLVPDFAAHVRNGVGPIKGYTLMNANYEFGTDNLLDLSHIEFVHKGSFAGAGVIFAGEYEIRQEGESLLSNWWMPNVPAPAHTVGIYERGMMTDHWLEMRWDAPASMLLEIGATSQGGRRDEGVIVKQAHILTPETETTTHYFWSTTRNSDLVVPEGDAMLRALMAQAFDGEDKPIIEAAYANLDGQEFWDAKPIFLGVDGGGGRARRLLQSKVAAEQRVTA